MHDEKMISQDDPFIPFSLRFLLEESGDGPYAPVPAPAPTPQERVTTVRALRAKAAKLAESEFALYAVLDTTADQRDRDLIFAGIDAAVTEKFLCDARASAIDHGRDFRSISAEAQRGLLAAIQEVSGRLANTANWGALLSAVHGLVQSFGAKDS